MSDKTPTERWAFNLRELENPAACCGYDDLVANLPGGDLGVLVQRNGTVTDRWEDGTLGVPPYVAARAFECDTLYNPQTNESTDGWWNVITDGIGNFIRFA